MTVPCPKCKGGCDVCGGAGRVPEGVARVYMREEGRATTKIPAGYATRLWPDEVPTKPDIIRKADRRRMVLLGLLIFCTAFVGVLFALVMR